MPTGHDAWPVSGLTANAEGSRSWETTGVKAVFAVDAGGGAGKFAESGPGGAGAAEGRRSGVIVAIGGGSARCVWPKIGKSG
jgi:hypothetical protein